MAIQNKEGQYFMDDLPRRPKRKPDASGKNRTRSERDYPEVYLEPIQDPGFDDVPGDAVAFDFKARKRKHTLIVLLCCALALIACIVVYLYAAEQKRIAAEAAAQLAAEEALRQQQALEQAEYEALTTSTVFLDGVTVDKVPIGGMTLAEARTALATVAAGYLPTGDLQLTFGERVFSLDLSAISATNNLESILSEAYQLGKVGDYKTVKAQADEIKAKGRDFTLALSYDFSALSASIAEIAKQIDTEPVNAAVTGIDEATRTILFTDGTAGRTVLQDELLQTITEAILNGNYAPVAVPVMETPPAVSSEELTGKYVLRASATTSFSGSNSNRIFNITKGCGLISGTVLKPGQEFSTNDTLGTRTLGNGWKMAGAYVGGAVVEEAGGGVCQLSSTLYNAVVKADLAVVSRRNHSMPVTYIDQGLAATINSVGNIIDFKFKNNTTSDVIVYGFIEGKKLTFEIWGLPFSTTEYDEIRLTASKRETLAPPGDLVIVEVAEGTAKPTGGVMVAGETYVAVQRREGSRWQSYKCFYKNGELVRKEALAESVYKAIAGEEWYCPLPYIIPDPSTPDPGTTDPGTTDPGTGGDGPDA